MPIFVFISAELLWYLQLYSYINDGDLQMTNPIV